MAISSRERFKAIARFQLPGELYMPTPLNNFWPETLRKWIDNGAPAQLTENTFRGQFFGFEHMRVAHEIVSGMVDLEYEVGDIKARLAGTPIVPTFDTEIISQDEKTITLINQVGQTAKVSRDDPQHVMPMYLAQPVTDRETWKEFKKRLNPDTPERWPADWGSYVEKLNNMDFPVILNVGSFFGFLREWMGLEKLLYTFYDDPALLEDMMDTILELELAVVRRTLKDIKVDQASFWEDMCYKAGPLISPKMFRKFMMPRYRQITDILHQHGVDIIFVDSDGNVGELIPLWLEVGVNFIWPFEVAAGNDVVAIRKEYGKELIIAGALDKRELLKDKESIRREVMSKVPFLLEQGGYFPSIDHEVPPDISFENYCYFINTLREVAGLDKLEF